MLGFMASQGTELGKQSSFQAPHPHSLVNRWEADTGRFGHFLKSIEERQHPPRVPPPHSF